MEPVVVGAAAVAAVAIALTILAARSHRGRVDHAGRPDRTHLDRVPHVVIGEEDPIIAALSLGGRGSTPTRSGAGPHRSSRR